MHRLRVDLSWLPNDKVIFHKFAYILPEVNHGDFVDLIGINPDLASSTLENDGGSPLLKLQRYHGFSSQPETLEWEEELEKQLLLV